MVTREINQQRRRKSNISVRKKNKQFSGWTFAVSDFCDFVEVHKLKNGRFLMNFLHLKFLKPWTFSTFLKLSKFVIWMRWRWSTFDSNSEFLYLRLTYKINATTVWGTKSCKANSNSTVATSWNKPQDFRLSRNKRKRFKSQFKFWALIKLQISMTFSIEISFTVHDVHHDGSRISVWRRTRIFAGVVHVHVSYQQIVGESFSVLGELRQPRLRLKAQHLQQTFSHFQNSQISNWAN